MLAYALSGKLSGEVYCPISKSELHRLLIASSLSDTPCEILGYTPSDDILATASVLKSLGAQINFSENSIYVHGISPSKLQRFNSVCCDCHESGSTLRFLLPLFAVLGQQARFIGQGRLAKRPMEPLLTELAKHGISLSFSQKDDTLPLDISGEMSGGDFVFPGNISSQYITGLLFSLPLLPCKSRILLTSPLESSAYVDMTLDVLSRFGIKISPIANGWEICGNQFYHAPDKIVANGDWSAAAFWLCAGAISNSSSITLHHLDSKSLQGDKSVCSILSKMGAEIISQENSVTAFPGKFRENASALFPGKSENDNSSISQEIRIDASQIPDIIPILAVAAAVHPGQTNIINASRLRMKESDRLHAICQNLTVLGADVTEFSDGMVIQGKPELHGGRVSSFNDHRIAMSMAIASLVCREEVILEEPLCVAKSYPDFYNDFTMLGGHVRVIDLG